MGFPGSKGLRAPENDGAAHPKHKGKSGGGRPYLSIRHPQLGKEDKMPETANGEAAPVLRAREVRTAETGDLRRPSGASPL